MNGNRSGSYRRPGSKSRHIRAQTARLRAERDVRPRRVDGTQAPDGLAMRARASAVLLLFFLGFAAIVGRAGWLAVGPDPRLTDRLAGQHERVVTVAPQRGSIVDRLGRPLAVSVELDSVFADPSMVEDSDAAAELLAPLLDREQEDLRARLAREGTRFVWLARQVPTHVADQVDALDIPGVRITQEAHREYPAGPLAGSMLGFVGTDGQGLEGLEARFDTSLMGEVVEYRMLRDGRRRPVNADAVLSRRSTEGHTLVTTLDHSIQHRAELSLSEAMTKYKAIGGQVIALDVQTGAILAMASAPGFDPNHFRGVDPASFRSQGLSVVYEPGSTMKPFVIAEVLDQKLATRDEEIYCEKGAYRIGRRTVHDAHPHATLTVDGVLQVSSNIGLTKLGERLGPKALEEMFRRYGFGAKTGVELREEKGILHPSSSWSRIGFATHTFGQGMAITGLQLASGFAALVNGGVAVQPHLVTEVRDTDGLIVEDRRPPMGERMISEATSVDMRAMLGLVVEDGGTGIRARLDEYTSGGKTGTAQKVKDGRYAPGIYVSSFIGFAPRDNPRVVVLAVLDEPKGKHYGGTVAGPIVKEVLTHAMRELGVVPDRENEKVPDVIAEVEAAQATLREEAAARAAEAAEEDEAEVATDDGTLPVLADAGPWAMPDLTGRPLREAVAVLGPAGVDLQLDGAGLVVNQTPAVGEPLASAQTVTLGLQFRGQSKSVH
ncbi:MAG: transpeptidase family protein [Proteobacteria bacterium]|nr:transpeptidase family protein [Pseudomonadota bacterium]